MIIVQHVFLAFLFSEVGGLADKIDAFVRKEGRNANSGELEMVGTEIVSFLRFGFRNDGTVLSSRVRAKRIFKCGVTEADDPYVAGPAPDVNPIDVDVGQGPIQRIKGMSGVILRTEQAFFFGSHGEKENGSLGSNFGEGLGEFEQCSGAGGV